MHNFVCQYQRANTRNPRKPVLDAVAHDALFHPDDQVPGALKLRRALKVKRVLLGVIVYRAIDFDDQFESVDKKSATDPSTGDCRRKPQPFN